MTYAATWHNLLSHAKELPSDASLTTPLSRKTFWITDVQENRILIEYRDNDGTVPLQRDQFEKLYQNVTESFSEFDIDRLPPNAEPYAAVLTLHPNVRLDNEAGTLTETETPSSSPLLETNSEDKNEVNASEQLDPQIQEMIDNMGDPEEVICPIDGCDYSHRSASSVARHVSGKSTAKHIWENTSYGGWRDFVRKHGESPG